MKLPGSDSPTGPWKRAYSLEKLFGYEYWRLPANRTLLHELSVLRGLWLDAGKPSLREPDEQPGKA